MYVYVYMNIHSENIFRNPTPDTLTRGPASTTKGPMWGYPVFVLGAVCSFLEPFRGHLSPNIDNVSEKLTFEIPPRRALGGSTRYQRRRNPLAALAWEPGEG